MLHGYLPSLLDGAWVTLRVAVFSLLLALVLGLIGASSRLSPNPLLRLPATIYTTVVRGIPDLDPQADVGHHELEYALYPHSGDWRQALTVRAGLELNLPLLARQEMHRSGMMQQWARPEPYQSMPDEFSFLHIKPANIVMTALKVEHEHWGEFAPFIVRCYETAGVETVATLTFAAPLRFAEETDHLERSLPEQSLQQDGERVTLTFHPHEIKTLRLSLAIPGFAIYAGPHRDTATPGETGGFERG